MAGQDRRDPGAKTRRALGRLGEKLAARYLQRHGFRIVARNLHLRQAEIDLVAIEGRTLCFVEVRLRRSRRFGSPAESVDRRKRARIVRAAILALSARRWPPHDRLRFDVVCIDASQRLPKIELLRGAFEAGPD